MLEAALLLSFFFSSCFFSIPLFAFSQQSGVVVFPLLKEKKNKKHAHYQDKVDVVFFFLHITYAKSCYGF